MIIILRQCVFYNCITFICTKHNADWRIVALVHHFPCVIVFAYDGIFKKVGYLVRERYLGGRVYLVSVNVRIAVYRARKRGAVCEHFDYFVFLRRYGYYDRIAEFRFAVGYARNGAVSVRVVHTPVSTTAVIAASISAAEVENEYSEKVTSPATLPRRSNPTSVSPIADKS